MKKQHIIDELELVFERVISVNDVGMPKNGVIPYDATVLAVDAAGNANTEVQSFYVVDENTASEKAFYASRKIHPDLRKHHIIKTELLKNDYAGMEEEDVLDVIKNIRIKPTEAYKATWQSITSAVGLTQASIIRHKMESLIAAPKDSVPASFGGAIDLQTWVVLQRSLAQINLWLKEDGGVGLNMNDPKAENEMNGLVAMGLITADDLISIKKIGTVSFEEYHGIKLNLNDIKLVHYDIMSSSSSSSEDSETSSSSSSNSSESSDSSVSDESSSSSSQSIV